MATRALAPTYHDVDVDTELGKATVHYVEAGDKSKPTFLLLMGFPSSSTHYRDFIPLVADQYHVLVPDFPGFGLTKAPSDFKYTFDNLTVVISAWLKKLGISSYATYIFDYGAPVAFRLALENPSAIKAIVTQNGNAYDAGFGQDFWKPIFNLWETNNSQEARDFLRDNALTQALTDYQYYEGVPAEDRSLVDPEQPVRDYLQNLAGKENQEHQLDLFYDYRTNKASYPKWHEYLRTSKVPVLAVWGKGDPAFIAAGAEAYKENSPHAEVHLLDAGHFALETKRWEIAELSKEFLGRVKF
jgi:pimeloyl-ACP methyl ester carboxylesterase